ncbi:YuzL family protein [Metabacillus arenae]|uniref:YuzL family protein n=1 Tax=Metabacillus arenae TaxID=2771434 RepID=A0A926NC94_9BACI|nr:YuzL family protein [Metabacillus arenae]MBD1381607.1 YuzL family protein [Metabacillus arenae]
MSKRKKDPSTASLGSPDVQGQGTTSQETGISRSSARKKKKK